VLNPICEPHRKLRQSRVLVRGCEIIYQCELIANGGLTLCTKRQRRNRVKLNTALARLQVFAYWNGSKEIGRPVARFQDLGGQNMLLRGQDICFHCMCETNCSGHRKIWGTKMLGGTATEWSLVAKGLEIRRMQPHDDVKIITFSHSVSWTQTGKVWSFP